MIQTSCSELLVDTRIFSPNKAYKVLRNIFERFGLDSDPPLSIELLSKLRETTNNEGSNDIIIFDSKGNRTYLEFGNNGYAPTGFRLDTHCNHGDEKSFPIFKIILDNIQNSALKTFDGGSSEIYEEWENEQC